MASIYSDEMKEKILADFSSKNPKVSASIIERFGENPRNKGLGSLTVEQYRDTIDAPLYASQGTRGGVSDALQRLTAGEISLQEYMLEIDPQQRQELMTTLSDNSDVIKFTPPVPDAPVPDAPVPETPQQSQEATRTEKLSAGADIAQGIAAIVNMFTAGKYDKAVSKAPKYKAPKPTEIQGVGGIGMNDGGTVLNRKLFLGGGEVDGIGGERDDLVPIWASDKEYVVSANGVRRMGGGNHARGIAALDKINNNGRLI